MPVKNAGDMMMAQQPGAPAPQDQGQKFETAFANLAEARLREKVPELMTPQYLVGFQVLDKSDEGDRGVGIFGFKAGDNWLYAPVFYNNGMVKGHDLLYVKGDDMMVPLEESWVKYILNRRPYLLGGFLPKEEKVKVIPPDFTAFTNLNPESIKAGTEEWVHGCFGMFSMKNADYSSMKEKLDLRETLTKTGAEGLQVIANTIRHDPNFGRAIAHFYTMDHFRSMELPRTVKTAQAPQRRVYKGEAHYVEQSPSLVNTCGSCQNFARGACKVVIGGINRDGLCKWHHSKESPADPAASTMDAREMSMSLLDAIRPQRDITKPKLVVYRVDDSEVSLATLSDEEKTKLLEDGVLVRDMRTDDDVSRVYDGFRTDKLTNPCEGGVYSTLMASNDFKDLIILPLNGPARRSRGLIARHESWLLYDPKTKHHRITDRICDVWVKPGKVANIVDAFGGEFSAPKSADYDDTDTKGTGGVELDANPNKYVVVGKDMNIGPFYIVKTINGTNATFYEVSEEKYRISRNDARIDQTRDEYVDSKGRTRTDDYRNGLYVSGVGYVHNIVLPNQYEGNVRGVNGQLLINDDAAWLKLDDTKTDLEPGNVPEVVLGLCKVGSHLKVVHDGINYWVSSTAMPQTEGMDKLATVLHLMSKHGVRRDDAETMVKRAQENRTARFMLKYGADYPQTYAESFGFDSGTGMVTQNPRSEIRIMPKRQTARLDEQTVNAAYQAAKLGKKEFFDTSVLGGMVKLTNIEDKIDEFTGDLMKGMDRAGRLLFLFYLRPEAFIERYGQDDVPEMEDSIRSVFSSIGDLTLFLRKRSVDDNDPVIEL